MKNSFLYKERLGIGLNVCLLLSVPLIFGLFLNLRPPKAEAAVQLQATKVVPILSAGNGLKLGAARISGEKHAVSLVKAVAQLEGGYQGIARFKALVPIGALDLTHLKRVKGVGVDALIDMKF